MRAVTPLLFDDVGGVVGTGLVRDDTGDDNAFDVVAEEGNDDKETVGVRSSNAARCAASAVAFARLASSIATCNLASATALAAAACVAIRSRSRRRRRACPISAACNTPRWDIRGATIADNTVFTSVAVVDVVVATAAAVGVLDRVDVLVGVASVVLLLLLVLRLPLPVNDGTLRVLLFDEDDDVVVSLLVLSCPSLPATAPNNAREDRRVRSVAILGVPPLRRGDARIGVPVLLLLLDEVDGRNGEAGNGKAAKARSSCNARTSFFDTRTARSVRNSSCSSSSS
jgi:hypothetical protein